MEQTDITRGATVYFIHPDNYTVERGIVENMTALFDKRILVTITTCDTDNTIDVRLEHVFLTKDEALVTGTRHVSSINDYLRKMKSSKDILNFMANNNVKTDLAAATAVKLAAKNILNLDTDTLKF